MFDLRRTLTSIVLRCGTQTAYFCRQNPEGKGNKQAVCDIVRKIFPDIELFS